MYRRMLEITSLTVLCAYSAVCWGQIPGFARSGRSVATTPNTPVAVSNTRPTITPTEQKELVHTILSTLSDEEDSSPAVFVGDKGTPEALTAVAGASTEKRPAAPVPVTPYTGEQPRPHSGKMLTSLLNDIAAPAQSKGKITSERKVQTSPQSASANNHRNHRAAAHSAASTGETPSFFSGILRQKNGGTARQMMKRRPLAELLKDDEPTEVAAARPVPQPAVKAPTQPQSPAAGEIGKEESASESLFGKVTPITAAPEAMQNDPILGSLAAESAEERPAALKVEKTDDLESLSGADLSAVTLDDEPQESHLASESSRENVSQSQAPVIQIKASGAKRLMVGQEAEYTLHVQNISGSAADGLVVTTAIPQGIEVLEIQPTVGTSRISEVAESESQTVCLWKLGVLPPGKDETLLLKFIPRVRSNIDFVSEYDYEKTSIKSGIEVLEPVLELTVEGRDTIDWGIEDKYRMQIRNTGNGEAKNVRLTVATGENDSATRLLETLAPGEEKTMEINIKTVLDGSLLVKVDAAADYGFSASAEKSIEILRGDLDIFVEAPEMQFVNDTVDYLVHVGNTGRAILQDVEVAAAIPATVEFVSCSGDGVMDSAENRVVWKIPMIKPDEEFVYQVTAKMLRAGVSRMDVTAADKTGVASNGQAQVQIEAIAALEMKINKPSGPIALGTEVEYEIVIINSGTKAAEQIDAGFFLPSGMKPLSVEGGGVIAEDNSKVLFSKISFLGPGQSVAYKVRAAAEQGGNHKVQAVLESRPDDIQLVAEEMNYFYQKRTVAKRNTPSAEMLAMKPNTTAPVLPVAPSNTQPNGQPTLTPAPSAEKPAEQPLSSTLSTTPSLPLPQTDLPFPEIPLALPGPAGTN